MMSNADFTQDHAVSAPDVEQATPPVQDKSLTAEGLIIKNTAKIERLRCNATQEDVTFYSWQFSRITRRDFYLLSHKLFHLRIARPQDNARRKHLLEDVREEADVLESMALRYEMPPAPTPIQLNLRVVSDHAQLLLDSLCIADRALTKLLASDQADNAEHLCADFYAAYARLKVHLLRKNDSATARNAEHADQHDRDDV